MELAPEQARTYAELAEQLEADGHGRPTATTPFVRPPPRRPERARANVAAVACLAVLSLSVMAMVCPSVSLGTSRDWAHAVYLYNVPFHGPCFCGHRQTAAIGLSALYTFDAMQTSISAAVARSRSPAVPQCHLPYAMTMAATGGARLPRVGRKAWLTNCGHTGCRPLNEAATWGKARISPCLSLAFPSYALARTSGLGGFNMPHLT